MKRLMVLTPMIFLAGTGMAAAQSASPFSGLYIGATGGYESYDVEIRAQKEDDDIFGDGGLLDFDDDHFSPSMKGWFYGGLLGYRVQTGNMVWGVEGLLTKSRADKTIVTPTGNLYLDSDITYGVSGMIGSVMNERTLVFLKGGYVWNDFGTPVDVDNDDGELDDIFDSDDNSETLGGIRVGAGAEFAMTQNISLRGEANYTFYESYPDADIARYVDPDAWQLSAALIYSF
jgi:outer membrane immunogenic protein